MKTFQDLAALGDNEKARREFLLEAINAHKSSGLYKDAEIAEKYFDGENVTIARYEKIIYDFMGRAHVDLYTANHKIFDHFFPMAVQQKVSYLLGNGVMFSENRSARLGRDFDRRVMEAAEKASWGGVSFGFFNNDHVQIFSVREFVPLQDEETGAYRAGIRWWQLAEDKPLRITLYEEDGYTEYIRRKGEELTEFKPKREYIEIVQSSAADGEERVAGANYAALPLVPLKNNDKCRSDLAGKRNTLDALDLAESGMVNNVAEGNLIYWVLKNCGGMDDLDDARFLDKLRTTHVAHTETGEGEAEPHTIEAPFQGTKETIDMLKKQLFEDFQSFDSAAVSAGNQTATAIRASYVPLDLKIDRFEAQVTEFISGILKLAGIDDVPSYTRNQIINKLEETQTVLAGAVYLSEEYITKKIMTILGDVDQFEDVQTQKSGADMSRIGTEE